MRRHLSKLFWIPLLLLVGCSSELNFSDEDLVAIREAGQIVFGDEARFTEEFGRGVIPEAFTSRGAKAAHLEDDGLYLVYYGYLKEESGVFVPREGKLPEPSETYEPLGQDLFWYHTGG